MAGVQFELWLEFEEWQPSPEDDPEHDGFNMTITLSSGEVYALNVWTYKLLERVRQTDGQTGANLGGKYLLPPDLLVEKLERPLLEAIVADLIAHDRLRDEWLVKETSIADDPVCDGPGDDPIFAQAVEQMEREGRVVARDEDGWVVIRDEPHE